MYKKTEDLQVGDWVLLHGMLIGLPCGSPWQVTKINPTKISLIKFHAPNYDLGDTTNKMVNKTSVVLAFSTEAEANDAADLGKEIHKKYDAAIDQIKKEHKDRVSVWLKNAQEAAE